MIFVHIQMAKILLCLDDDLNIIGAMKVPKSYRPHQSVIRCSALYSTPNGLPQFIGPDFETDGLGCIRLFHWICETNPKSSRKTQRYKFDDLFDANPIDTIKAMMYIFKGVKAPGEIGYFCAQQWKHHPEEMKALSFLGALDLELVSAQILSNSPGR